MKAPHLAQYQFRPKPKPADWSISLLCLFVLFELAQLMVFQWVLERAG